MKKHIPLNENNLNKKSTQDLNELTYMDYFNRIKNICTSIFEWINLPTSMNAFKIENDLFYYGQCAFLYDNNYSYINTNCSDSGNINIYNLPLKLNCYSNEYNKLFKTYTSHLNLENKVDKTNYCILVMNNLDRIPTSNSIELFAQRLTKIERIKDINLNALKTPVLILTDQKQQLSLKNLYQQYDGNAPIIYGDKNSLSPDSIKAVNTKAEYLLDKLSLEKKEVWNDLLTFLGVNNLETEKKERLITSETEANNDLINYNLNSFLQTRKIACKQFNELYKENIDVRVRKNINEIINNEVVINE